MQRAISHIARLMLSAGLMVGGPYSARPWEEDEKFNAMINGRHHQLFHNVRDGVSWRSLVHKMFEEDANEKVDV